MTFLDNIAISPFDLAKYTQYDNIIPTQLLWHVFAKSQRKAQSLAVVIRTVLVLPNSILVARSDVTQISRKRRSTYPN